MPTLTPLSSCCDRQRLSGSSPFPKRSRSFARLPGGVGRDPGRGAREAGAVAAPPNPFGASPTAPEHPFPEVSFSPLPISLLPDLAARALQPAWKGVCRFVRAWICKPTRLPGLCH